MNPRRKRTQSRKRPLNPYTAGELNRIIDQLCHPLFKTNEGFRLVDGVLHGLVEQNLNLTLEKFAKYNLPDLLALLKNK